MKLLSVTQKMLFLAGVAMFSAPAYAMTEQGSSVGYGLFSSLLFCILLEVLPMKLSTKLLLILSVIVVLAGAFYWMPETSTYRGFFFVFAFTFFIYLTQKPKRATTLYPLNLLIRYVLEKIK